MMRIFNNWRNSCMILIIAFFFLLFQGVKSAMADDLAEGNGHIDRIDNWQIIIDDCTYFLTSSTLFFNMEGQTINKSFLQRGQLISFREDGKGRLLSVSIQSLDLKRSRTGQQQSSDRSLPAQSDLVHDNGVWRNVLPK